MENTILSIMLEHKIYVNVFPVVNSEDPRWKFELYAVEHETLLIDNVSESCRQDMDDTWLYSEAVELGIERALELVH